MSQQNLYAAMTKLHMLKQAGGIDKEAVWWTELGHMAGRGISRLSSGLGGKLMGAAEGAQGKVIGNRLAAASRRAAGVEVGAGRVATSPQTAMHEALHDTGPFQSIGAGLAHESGVGREAGALARMRAARPTGPGLVERAGQRIKGMMGGAKAAPAAPPPAAVSGTRGTGVAAAGGTGTAQAVPPAAASGTRTAASAATGATTSAPAMQAGTASRPAATAPMARPPITGAAPQPAAAAATNPAVASGTASKPVMQAPPPSAAAPAASPMVAPPSGAAPATSPMAAPPVSMAAPKPSAAAPAAKGPSISTSERALLDTETRARTAMPSKVTGSEVPPPVPAMTAGPTSAGGGAIQATPISGPVGGIAAHGSTEVKSFVQGLTPAQRGDFAALYGQLGGDVAKLDNPALLERAMAEMKAGNGGMAAGKAATPPTTAGLKPAVGAAPAAEAAARPAGDMTNAAARSAAPEMRAELNAQVNWHPGSVPKNKLPEQFHGKKVSVNSKGEFKIDGKAATPEEAAAINAHSAKPGAAGAAGAEGAGAAAKAAQPWEVPVMARPAGQAPGLLDRSPAANVWRSQNAAAEVGEKLNQQLGAMHAKYGPELQRIDSELAGMRNAAVAQARKAGIDAAEARALPAAELEAYLGDHQRMQLMELNMRKANLGHEFGIPKLQEQYSNLSSASLGHMQDYAASTGASMGLPEVTARAAGSKGAAKGGWFDKATTWAKANPGLAIGAGVGGGALLGASMFGGRRE